MTLPTAAALMRPRKDPKVALESFNGAPHNETEYTFYAKLKSLKDLEGAKHREMHEQWRFPVSIDNGVKFRIRETNGIRWQFTSKQTIPGKVGVIEIDTEVTKEKFAALRLAATDGYRKERFVFPVFGKDRMWEIDVFFNQLGEKSLWVKIDLEVKDGDYSIPEFPFELEDIITNQDSDQTVDETNFIRRLWDSEWCSLDEAAG